MNPSQTGSAIALFLIASTAFPASGSSQNGQNSSNACPAAADMDHQHLQGRWHATLQDAHDPARPAAATVVLQLGPHPELAHSVRGTVQRGGASALVSGDVDEGDLTLEESNDGTRISATWIGRVVEGSCGSEIRGTWTGATPAAPGASAPAIPSAPFVLRKQAGWK